MQAKAAAQALAGQLGAAVSPQLAPASAAAAAAPASTGTSQDPRAALDARAPVFVPASQTTAFQAEAAAKHIQSHYIDQALANLKPPATAQDMAAMAGTSGGAKQKSEGRRVEAETRIARKRRLREEAKQASQASPAAPSQQAPEAQSKRARLATPQLASARGASVAQEVRPFLMQVCLLLSVPSICYWPYKRRQKVPL